MRSSSLARSLGRAVACCLLALASSAAAAQAKATTLHAFESEPFGANPVSQLIADAAGNLYGSTEWGGAYNRGVVFELERNANGRTSSKVLYTFSDLYEDDPPSRLVVDSAGNLYGTIQYTESVGCGVVFRLSPSTTGEWTYTNIYSFVCDSEDGQAPSSGLTPDRYGNLYGVTSAGGAYGDGTVYELTPSANGTWTEQVLYSFGSQSADGLQPQFEPVLDSAGDIFGITTYGGDDNCNPYQRPFGCGTIFELTQSSGIWHETVLHTNNIYPGAGLTMDSAGNLYGSDEYSLYELQASSGGSWTYASLPQPGGWVSGPLVVDKAGHLYGETTNGGNSGNGTIFALENSPSGVALSTIYTFPAPNVTLDPFGGLVLDADGVLYGTTYRSYDQGHNGSIFALTPSSGGTWNERTLYQFPIVDGYDPIGDLIADSAGNLYGVAQGGPSANSYGIVFRLTPVSGGRWQYEILYEFLSTSSSSPASPSGGLVFDSAGNLYGVTGGGSGGIWGYGTVYELSPSSTGYWKETTLYSFGSFKTDGNSPHGKLVFDRAGNLYGTTELGGLTRDTCFCYGFGTVFELSPQGDGTWQERTLFSFSGGRDGDGPDAGLIIDQSGNLYGTTFGGGNGSGCEFSCGVVFKLAPAAGGSGWTESVLFNFNSTTGGWPEAGLIQDSAGNLYGTTAYWGPDYFGSVFELSPNISGRWTETTLHSFTGQGDGGEPYADLSFDIAGNLYGTTFVGGNTTCYPFASSGCGTVFKLTPSSAGDWAFSTLHAFGSSPADGINPQSGVYIDGSGNLFTTTIAGPGLTPSGYDGTGGTIAEIKP